METRNTSGIDAKAQLGTALEMEKVSSLIASHAKLAEAFPFHRGEEPFPYQQAKIFLDNFHADLVLPAVEAKERWIQLYERLLTRSSTGAVISPQMECEISVAARQSCEASQRLRCSYDEWIPFLRFGYPELSSHIRVRVDEPCGLAALTSHRSPRDFQLKLLSRRGCVEIFSAATMRVSDPSGEKKIGFPIHCVKRYELMDDFLRETEVMKIASHPNVTEICFSNEEVADGRVFYSIATPWYPLTIPQWITTNGSHAKEVLRILRETVSGLSCLHNHGIVHGNLKPTTILMDGEGMEARPKLTSFLYSTVVAPSRGILNADLASNAPLSLFSPREFKFTDDGPSLPTPASDVYSLGKTFELVLGCLSPLLVEYLAPVVTGMTAPYPEHRLALAGNDESVATRLRRIAELVSDVSNASKGPAIENRLDWTKTSIESIRLDLKSDTGCFTAWIELGHSLGPNESRLMWNKPISKRRCYIEALRLNIKAIDAWYCLGMGMLRHEQIILNDSRYSKLQCLHRALTLSPRSADLWIAVGDAMSTDQHVEVNNRRYSKRECYAKAIELGSKNEHVWDKLRTGMTLGEVVNVDGSRYVMKKKSKFTQWHKNLRE